jgi:hypothetical protein
VLAGLGAGQLRFWMVRGLAGALGGFSYVLTWDSGGVSARVEYDMARANDVRRCVIEVYSL